MDDLTTTGTDPVETNASATSGPTAVGPSSRWTSARRRAMELLIVFVGVYSAFLLNRLESDQRDSKRKAQILVALERETRSGVEEIEEAISQNEPLMAEFERRLTAGEMPGLAISMNNSSYSATDDATLLQAGGLELLDVQTIELLRHANAMERAITVERHNQFELSLAELTNHQAADFYEPTTHQLKKSYQWWPYVQRQSIEDAKALLAAKKMLLGHIQSEQGHPSPAPSSAAPTTPSGSPPASKPGA